MADLWHQFGGDLAVDATGDLLTADRATLTEQRLIRRFLTAAQAYIWHLDYGGGLPAFVGSPANAARIGAVIRTQALLEDTVARTPIPTATVAVSADGTVTATVRYADANTGQTQILTFPIG